MLLRHSTLSLFLLIFVTVTHLAAGVQIDSVGMDSGLPYVHRLFPAHIKFHLTMEPAETLQSVVWQREDERGRYEWEANGSVRVSGILVGAIDISAANGELLFPFAQLDHEGNYSLTVFTSNGNDTATYKLIVHYYYQSIFSHYITPLTNCTWSVEMKVYQAAPFPNISCVFEDGIGGGQPSVPLDVIAEVKQLITDHRNGTFNYEMASNIPIQKVPVESSMSCQFWIEESSISLFKLKPSVTAQYCPEPDIKINLTYSIISGYESCYGGYSLYTKVNYSCTDDPKSEPHKTLECSSGGSWIDTDATPWPTCSTHVQPTTTPKPEPTTTECENCNAGTALIFHPKLFAATFLIASYYAMK